MVTVLYDGNCRLCRRSVFILRMLDWRRCIAYMDIHPSTAARNQGGILMTSAQGQARSMLRKLDSDYSHTIAPHLNNDELSAAITMRFPDTTVLQGFLALRRLSWYLPPLWPIAPFLYLPGMRWLGPTVYRFMAKHRK